ncbi:MAG: UMP kinase [Bifidobacteriaceae bacterium]|jgi:uridylate kinase|nr:UMP kinase [Bifidobacteriaceae bacterium]
MANKPRRVLLKISGESLGGGELGINTSIFRQISEEVVRAVNDGVQVAIVVGGGNFFRGEELQKAGYNRNRADYMGMLGTVINCLALQDILLQSGAQVRVQTAISMRQVSESYVPLRAVRHLEKGRVVIFGAGAGMPFFSTDTVSIQRALEIECDEVLMGKNGVDGVYDKDPNVDSSAKKFDHLTYHQALMQELKVMDASAMSLADTNSMKMRVFGLDGDNVYKALIGENIGTSVTKN